MWASASRAVRTPSRGEKDGAVVSRLIPPGSPPFVLPLPLFITINGNKDLMSEEILAYELGYRFKTESLFLDFAVFYNDYDRVRSVVQGPTICQPGGDFVNVNPACLFASQYLEGFFNLANDTFSKSVGAEVWLAAEMNDWWNIDAAYTYYHSKVESGISQIQTSISEDSPEHQVSVRSSMEFAEAWQFDLWARYVDELESQGIDSYTALDLRLAWQATESLEVSAVGRNLIADEHVEFISELADLYPVQIEPQYYVELRWNF
jgi:iron complex outermembrane receptor protein